MFKIAFIKEACYQDLWIGDNNDTSSDLIKSTLLRTGPIGLLEIFGSDWETPDGTGVRDYIHVMDVAEGHYFALEYILKRKSNYMQFNLGTGKGTSVLELVKTFETVNNVKVPYKFSFSKNSL